MQYIPSRSTMSPSYQDGENISCKVCGCAAPNANFPADTLDIDNVHNIDSHGNQAAHIAARLNHVDCFKILIQNDARMGKKNFAGESFADINHSLFFEAANSCRVHFPLSRADPTRRS